ncbi:hypothetical protein JW935_15870 [candidate division KSB1 bacterium]|nr:hypothetical protein [candidate division KSB1 bacterium]
MDILTKAINEMAIFIIAAGIGMVAIITAAALMIFKKRKAALNIGIVTFIGLMITLLILSFSCAPVKGQTIDPREVISHYKILFTRLPDGTLPDSVCAVEKQNLSSITFVWLAPIKLQEYEAQDDPAAWTGIPVDSIIVENSQVSYDSTLAEYQYLRDFSVGEYQAQIAASRAILQDGQVTEAWSKYSDAAPFRIKENQDPVAVPVSLKLFFN